MKNFSIKRFTASLLFIVMVVAALPVSLFNFTISAAEDTDYLFFATDRHANTSVIGNIINNMESVIGENELDYLGLGGDMVGSGNNHPAYNSSEVLGEVTGATSSLDATNVDIVAGIHDMNVTDDAGIVLPYKGGCAQIYEGDKYYVYGVEEYCISDDSNESNWKMQSEAFVTWANGDSIDKSKVIIVLSHYPLHEERNDNDGAYYWHQALNTVATGSASDDTTVERNIVFFHGHNHTVDSNEYVYNVGDTMSIQNGSSTTSGTIYYTYATAGYLKQNNKATLMAITDSQITLTKYSTSGTGTVMTTVTRVVTEEEATLSSIAVTTPPTTISYTVGDTFSSEGMVVTATYSNDSTAAVTGYTLSDVDMASAGIKTVTVTYTEGDVTKTTTFDITVSDPYVTNIEVTTLPDKVEYITGESFDSTGMVVTATYNNGTTAEVTGWYTSTVDMTTVGEKEVTVNYTIDSITFRDTFTITVIEGVAEGVTLTGIEVTKCPTKTEYLISEELQLDGLVVVATFSDGSTKELEYAPFSTSTVYGGYNLDNFSMYVEKNHEVKVTYTFREVTCTAIFTINVWNEKFTSSDVTVKVTGDYGVTGADVADSTNTYVSDAVSKLLVADTYKAYDISLVFDEGYSTTNATKIVTLPIPEGVTDPVVYYVSDNGALVIDMGATNNGDRTVSFETTHFSTYVVGENAVVGEESDATVPGTEGSQTTTVGDAITIYKLVDTPVSGKQYLIVSSNTGIGYGLNSTTTGYSTTAWTNDGTYYTAWDSTTQTGTALGDGTYLITSDAYLWTVGDGLTFTNGSTKLGVETGTFIIWTTYSLAFDTQSSWILNNDTLNDTNYSRYLYCNNGTWSVEEDSANVYFYEPVTVYPVTQTGTPATPDTTYHMDLTVAGNTVSDHAYTVTGVVSGTTVQMGAVFTTTAEGTTTTMDGYPANGSFTVLSSSNESVATIGSDSVLTFTGAAGETLIQVEYTWTENGVEYKTQNYVVITAKTPVYGLSISADSTQIKIGAAANVTAAVTADGAATTGTVTWSSSDDSIATVDANGVVTGVTAGDVTITASYTDPNGTVHTAKVDISVVDAVYTLDLCEKNEDGTTVSITKPIAIKDVDTLVNDGTNTYPLWAVITADGEDIGTLNEEQLKKLTFISSDETIATVDKTTGIVTFTGKEGTVQITAVYEYADGKSVTDTVTFSVSKTSYVVPEDGTDDFPEYPNEGAVRFDKTATAVGNFSQTGMAMIELSMTGVPYSTGNELDVVLMLDTTGSMSNDGLVAMLTATDAFIDKIVINEDGTYNQNRVAVYFFNSSGIITVHDLAPFADADGKLLDTDSDGTSDFAEVMAVLAPSTYVSGNSYDFSNIQSSGGTPFDEAAAKCQAVLTAAKTTNLPEGVASADDYNRQQFCVFMSDGGPTTYYGSDKKTYYGGNNNSGDVTIASKMTNYTSSDSSTWSMDLPTEYYTDAMKADGVTVYTVGLLLQNTPSNPAPWSKMTSVSSVYNSTTDSLTTIGTHYYFTSSILKQMASDESKYIDIFNVNNADKATAAFEAIAMSILEAATDVVVEDKVDNSYSVNFTLPSGVTYDEAGMDEFYIQIVEYTLDPTTHDRTGTPNVIENFTFNTDGTLQSHTVDGTVTCDSTTCTHITFTNGKVTAINGIYFTYSNTEDGEILTWETDKISTTELALQYFVYLEGSAGVDAGNQTEAGVYYTNEYATLTYTNFNGKEVQQEFPRPQMTWKGAQVTYVFYLVNKNGEPVNKAGRVVPFAEAVYVTDPITYDVTWNEATGQEKLQAEYLAKDKVPTVYQLYDNEAYYEILVYQTEGVDSATNAVNYNHFIIEGSSSVTNKETTKVFNTKAGTKYDDYGAYSATAGSYTSTKSGTSYTATVTTDIDYADTTVAFAVVWNSVLQEDVVIIDYGLDVVIDVVTNDALASSLVGVRADAPSGVEINSGRYDAAMATSVDIYIDANNDADGLKELKIGTATIENLKAVRFSPDKTNGMQFTDHAVFYYESAVNFYDENGDLITANLYSSVTIIPATTIYYEESFVTFAPAKTVTVNSDNSIIVGDVVAEDATYGAWSDIGTAVSGTQAQDRPGDTKLPSLDANNVYGYDGVYSEITKYSLGTAKQATVNKAVNDDGSYTTTGYNGYAPTATFTFTGTGFDIISLTDSDSGMIMVTVADANGNNVYSQMITNYYGMSYEVVSKDENGNDVYGWVSTENGALYQVPVIKKTGLTYGTYTVTIQVGYMSFFDQDNGGTGDGEYYFVLDSIRVYDPANGGANDSVIEDAYKADGESNPHYLMVKEAILGKADLENLSPDNITGKLNGTVFIDGKGSTTDAADYANPGPNNEAYFLNAQSISFKLTATAVPMDVQLGAKLASGSSATVNVYYGSTTSDPVKIELGSLTDMYYSIMDKLPHTMSGNNWTTDTIIIEVVADDSTIVSLTNIKATFESATTVSGSEGIKTTSATASTGVYSLMSARMVNLETVAEEEPVSISFLVDAEVIEDACAVMTALYAPEPEIFVPEALEYTVTNRFFGNSTVNVITSKDVASLTVNGVEAKKLSNSPLFSILLKLIDGFEGRFGTNISANDYIVWSASVKRASNYDIVAYNADGLSSDPTVTDSSSSITKEDIDNYFNRSELYSIMEQMASQRFDPEQFEAYVNERFDGFREIITETSEDVEYVIINGKIVDRYITETVIDTETGETTTKRVWITDAEDDVDDEDVEVNAYDEKGVGSESKKAERKFGWKKNSNNSNNNSNNGNSSSASDKNNKNNKENNGKGNSGKYVGM